MKRLNLISPRELATRLSTSVGTVYDLVYKEKIPFHRISGLGLRFCTLEIDNWILKGGFQQ